MFRRASAAWPVAVLARGLLVQPGGMTCSHDGTLHLLRAVQLDGLARQGVWCSRWSPALVSGYGSPL